MTLTAVATAAPSPRERAAKKARARAQRSTRTATVTVRCDADFLGMGETYAYVEAVRGVADDLKLVIHDAVQAALAPAFDVAGNPAAGVDWRVLNRHLPQFLWGKVRVTQHVTASI